MAETKRCPYYALRKLAHEVAAKGPKNWPSDLLDQLQDELTKARQLQGDKDGRIQD